MNKLIKAPFAVILTFLLCGNLSFISSAQNPPQALVGITERVSISSDGLQGNGSSIALFSNASSISADGRYVAFSSTSSNLVVGDTNNNCDLDQNMIFIENCPDIFRHDRVTGETIRVSVTSNGTEGNRESVGASISADGRYVAFYSAANNLVVGDINGVGDVFVHDRSTGETTLASVSTDGMQGNFDSGGSSISADGRYLAFGSSATNLVLGDTNGKTDIFVRDREGLVVGYSVTGHVTDLGGNPLPGVSISAGYGYSAITDSQGDYSISSLPSGTYWITASLTDSSFIPFRRTVSVPPDRVGINFTEGFPAFLPLIAR